MKIKEFIKGNYKNLLSNLGIYLIFILLIFPIVFKRGIGDLDELWNYNFARNIANGLIPYKDFNMVQTPLLPQIAGIFLKVFSNELITMRVLAIILNSSILFIMYKILTKFNINKKIVLLLLIMWINLIKDYICIDYNYATLLITLIILYVEIFIRRDDLLKSDLKKDAIIGILAGINILFKQTTGLIICIVALFYKIVLIRKRDDLKEFTKTFVVRFLFILIPIALLIIYLVINKALPDFIDYAILGIQTFSNKISYINLRNSDISLISLLSILIPLVLIISYIYSTIKNKNEFNTLVSYSIGMFSVTFPISDNIHFLIGSTCSIIVIMYILEKCIFFKIKFNLENEKKIERIEIYIKMFGKTFLKLILIIYIIFAILNSILYFGKYIKNAKNYTKLEHFKYIEMSEKQLTLIKNVQDYILNEKNNVYILDSDAALYMIPLNRYNKDFDMFLKGNLGSKSEEGQIEKIKSMDKNTKILIKNDNYRRNWQNPNDVTEFVKSNLEKIDEIEYFDVYVK